jgi:opacity protein-like surface antigen
LGLFTDLLYARLEDKFRAGPNGGVKVNVEADQTIMEVGGFYRLGTWPPNPGSASSVTLDILGGARYNRIGGDVGIQARNHGLSLGRVEEWWDPFVGPRVNWHAMDKLDIFARADVGGFGLEHCSHVAWQFVGGADYHFTKNFYVELGFRLLDQDYTAGSGRNRFAYDLRMAGPYLALGLDF